MNDSQLGPPTMGDRDDAQRRAQAYGTPKQQISADALWMRSLVALVRAHAESGGEWAPDSERCHQAQDSIFEHTLKIISEGRTDDPAGVAREALQIMDVEFSRWYS